jgi:hypothetical protein
VGALVLPNAVAVVLIVLAACVSTGGPARRAAAIALVLAALLPQWALPDSAALFRGISTLVAFGGVIRVTDLQRGSWTLRERLRHVGSVIDTRKLVRASPRFEGRVVAVGLAWTAVEIAAYLLFVRGERASDGVPPPLARWGPCVLFVYASVSAGYALGRAAYAWFGWQTGPLHVAPIFARTVDELWAERWARPVSAWMRETFFRPLARRRHPVAGGLLSFAVSGAFHAYIIWLALGFVKGLAMAAWMFAYFIVQALVIGLERALGVRRWPAWRAHLWTAAWMLATSPLFISPMATLLAE